MDIPENPNPNLYTNFHSDPCPVELGTFDSLGFGSGSLLEHTPLMDMVPVPDQAIAMGVGGSSHPAKEANHNM